MKAKTIKAVITEKMNAWWESIDDEGLRTQVKKNTIVTGGCIASMFLKEPVNDFDIYFRNLATAEAVQTIMSANSTPLWAITFK